MEISVAASLMCLMARHTEIINFQKLPQTEVSETKRMVFSTAFPFEDNRTL